MKKINLWKLFQGLPFALQCVYNPFLALDLTDDDGYPDHSKILPTLATAGVLGLSALGHPLTAVVAVAVLAASFGFPMFKSFLESKSYTATATGDLKEAITNSKTTVTTIAQTLVQNQKHDAGA